MPEKVAGPYPDLLGASSGGLEQADSKKNQEISMDEDKKTEFGLVA